MLCNIIPLTPSQAIISQKKSDILWEGIAGIV